MPVVKKDKEKVVKAAKPEKTKKPSSELDSLIAGLREKFGDGAVMTLGEARKINVDVVPSGSFSLNLALGVGGFPRGRIVEIYGPESGGKTTLALSVVAHAQAQGGQCAYIDAEHALDPDYARRLGVKTDELLISQPDYGEEGLNIMETLVRSGMISTIVVDSVAALTPRVEIDGEMGAQHVGLQARMMSQALRKVTAIAARSNTLIIFINQLRMQVGVFFGNPEVTPGGKALKFYASVRVDVRRTAQIKKGDEVIGTRVKAKVVKNKVAAPFRAGEFDLMFDGSGISYEADVLNMALKYGIVKKAGASYSFEGEKVATGFDAVREKMRIDKPLTKRIETAVLADYAERTALVPEPGESSMASEPDVAGGSEAAGSETE